MGLVILEGMASGIPVIASDRSGGPDLIENGADGCVVGAGDSRALSDAIATLLDDPQRAADMGRAARAKVEREFSFERYLQRWQGILRQVPRAGALRRAGRGP
jgi:glycosyltransferase involved in cell wall biosynthesis